MLGLGPVVAAAARAANPATWVRAWRANEGRSAAAVADGAVREIDRQLARLHYVHERGQHVALWWANPLGYGLVLFLAFKTYQMVWLTKKQKKCAQTVAAAYGQGGQWLNPVPR